MKLLVIGDFQGEFSQKLFHAVQKEEFDYVIGVGDYAGLKEWRAYIHDLFKRIRTKEPRISMETFYGKKRYAALKKKEEKKSTEAYTKLNNIKKPVYFVFGNTDLGWYEYPFSKEKDGDKKHMQYLKKLNNLHSIQYKTKKLEDYSLIGFGGYMDIESFMKEKQFKDQGKAYVQSVKVRLKKSKEKLQSLFQKTARQKRIFVIHYPPMGVFDVIKDTNNPMNGRNAGVRAFTQVIKKYKPAVVFCGHMEEYTGKKMFYGVPVINPGSGSENKYALVEIQENGKVKATFKQV